MSENRAAEVRDQSGRGRRLGRLSFCPLTSDFCRSLTRGLASSARRGAGRATTLHADERGTISILTVAMILGLMFLLGMVTNVARHIDDKIKMQNAADAATYSGGVVLARGMNALAFSNHLLCDTFALTAFMRESRDRNAEALVPDILAAWSNVGTIFSRAEFPKFARLGPAIREKVPMEQNLVRTYSEMSAAASKLVLPVLEYVLRERLIPEFQRSVVQQMPNLAQETTNEIARRQGLHRISPMQEQQVRGAQLGVLWRTRLLPAGYPDEREPVTRTLPAVDPTPAQGSRLDPVPDPTPDPLEGLDAQSIPNATWYLSEARMQRQTLARTYLLRTPGWNPDRLRFFNYEGKMSQFFGLWQIFTCGQLDRLLNEEYANSNLPFLLRLTDAGTTADTLRRAMAREELPPGAANEYLDRDFMFVGLAYRRRFAETFPGFFRNPLAADPQAFAQVHLFIPRARLRYTSGGNMPGSSDQDIGGGGFGVDTPVPMAQPATNSGTEWTSEPWPSEWNLFNQNWMAQLVPATSESLASILQIPPQQFGLNAGASQPLTMPNLGSMTSSDLRQVNTH